MRIIIIFISFIVGVALGFFTYVGVGWVFVDRIGIVALVIAGLFFSYIFNVVEVGCLWNSSYDDVDDFSLGPISLGWFIGFVLPAIM